jgi:hypothetical protein
METTGVVASGSWRGSDPEVAARSAVGLSGEEVRCLAAVDLSSYLSSPRGDAQDERSTDVDFVLGRCADEIASRVRSGPGFALLTGDELDRFDDQRLGWFVSSVAQRLGRPLIQTPRLRRAVIVEDASPDEPDTATGYQSSSNMLLHTDAGDVAVLLGLSAAAEGGASILASSAFVYERLLEVAPELVPAYFEQWGWVIPQLEEGGTECVASSPIFSMCRGVLSCRYGSSVLRRAAEFHGQPLSARQEAALDRFESVCREPEVQFRHRILRGESVWINNFRVLHGRDAFRNGASRGAVRRMLRLWIQLASPLPVSPSMTEFEKVLFGSDYGGVDLGSGITHVSRT